MEDTLDTTAANALFDGHFEIDQFFGCEQNLSARHIFVPVRMMEAIEHGTRVQRLSDQLLLLRIEHVRNQAAVFTHDRRPEVHDLFEVQRYASLRDLIQTDD